MRAFALALLVIVAAPPAEAGIGSRAAQELAEAVMKKFGREAVGEGVETFAGRLTATAARHGDGVVTAVRKVGPRAITLADGAGANAPRVLRLLSRYGDDAVRVLSRPKSVTLISELGDDAAAVLIRHKGVAEPVLEAFGRPALHALAALGPQGGRRLALMGGNIAPGLLQVVARHGDRAMDFIWKHKEVLAGSIALTAFLANPEPFLDGTEDLARIGMEGVALAADAVASSAIKPAILAAGNVAMEAAVPLGRGLFALLLGLGLLAALVVRLGVTKSLPLRIAMRAVGKQFGKHVAAARAGRQ